MLSKHQRVMEMASIPHDTNVYFRTTDGGGFTTGGVSITKEVWDDMGRPNVITVTVEPDDLLNQKTVAEGVFGGKN